MVIYFFGRVEKIVGQGEEAGTSFFSFPRNLSHMIHPEGCRNFGLCGKGFLTLLQAENFRLFQTGRICNRHF